ncbi:hypothetical protein [Confluentibacter citreus]|uniref:hypothetical protein n=1 Tax=Confluentibacter citreus TaxID=2007307 RepID=UPI0012FE6B65|nr:hypothetical protein [Confluentibacter citreus]
MKKSIILFALILAFINCKNKSETNETSEPVKSNMSSGLLEVGCYSYNGNNSSITFEITKINTTITGNLNYHLAEKDANMGTFEGLLIDDIILGDYTFESEGVSSRREVIFKITNGQLFEGYGEMDDEGICFANTDHVTFTSTMPLTKTDCTK